MATPTKNHAFLSFPVRDLGFASALSATGWPVHLEDHKGIIHFLFDGDAQRFADIERSYWSGELKLPARDLIAHQKMLKDAIYSIKKPRY